MKHGLHLLLLTALSAASFSAEANHHVMNIREVYAGSNVNPTSQYILLQMRAAGQNVVNGKSVTAYDAAGALAGTYTFSSNVSNSASQAYILLATPAAQTEFGITPDLAITANLVRAGGKVCFSGPTTPNIDCFSWGSFSGSSTTPSVSGAVFNPAGGLVSGRAARRDISAGNANLLDTGDDTNSSAADFDFAPYPRPINNGGSTAAAPAIGAGVSLADFSNVAGLNLRGDAATQAGVLRLTPVESTPVSGAVWHLLRQPVVSGFDTTFQFRITPGSAAGRDGFAFLLQHESNSSEGTGGSGLGYGGISNGLAIEFDTHYNTAAEIGAADPFPGADAGDPAETAENHVSVHTQGTAANSASEAASIAASAALPALDDGAVHTARIVHIPPSLQVYVDDMDAPVLQTTVTLGTLLDLYSSAAFAGFTAASGTPGQDHDLLSWQMGDATPDTTPAAFDFTNISGVATGTVTHSSTITVRGINTTAAISIVGPATAKYSKNGGAFTNSAGTAVNGDTITLQVKSSPNANGQANVTFNLGTASDAWRVTAGAVDTTPAALGLVDVTGAATGTVISSAPITVTGINAATPVSLSGTATGKYSKNGGAYTNAPGSVVNGDTLSVQLLSSASANIRLRTTLNVGGVLDPWDVTTGSTDTTPVVGTLVNQTGVAPATGIFSNTAAISGINTPVNITLSSGPASAAYSINGGIYTRDPGTVSTGDMVQLKVTSSATAGARVTVRMQFGTIIKTWSVTTAP